MGVREFHPSARPRARASQGVVRLDARGRGRGPGGESHQFGRVCGIVDAVTSWIGSARLGCCSERRRWRWRGASLVEHSVSRAWDGRRRSADWTGLPLYGAGGAEAWDHMEGGFSIDRRDRLAVAAARLIDSCRGGRRFFPRSSLTTLPPGPPAALSGLAAPGDDEVDERERRAPYQVPRPATGGRLVRV